MTGIYEIRSQTGRYIGSSINILRRWRVHLHRLKKGTHHSAHLQAAWQKYGESAFYFRTLEICAAEHLREREQAYLSALRPSYNISTVVGHSTLGCKASLETRALLSRIAKNRPRRDSESRMRTSLSLLGNKRRLGKSIPHTKESRNKISNALKNHSVSPETREKLRYIRSEETRLRMSIAAKNRKRS